MKTKMKAKYTKKQIMESIKYWKKVLESIDESSKEHGKYLYITKNNPSFKGMVRKAGASGIKKLEDPYQYEVLSQKLNRYSTCVPIKWEAAYQVNIPAGSDIKQLEKELFSSIINANGIRYNEPGVSGNELFSINDNDMKTAIDEFIKNHPGCELIDAKSMLSEARQFNLADKESATNAIIKHNDEIYAFAEQKPKPTKDELIDFVSNMFKEEGLDTPWTRQFLIKMKMYTHGFDDALSYLFNARLKGQGLGMHMRESDVLTYTDEDNAKTLVDKVAALHDYASKVLEGHDADVAASILKKCYKDLIHSILPGSDDRLYEVSQEK